LVKRLEDEVPRQPTPRQKRLSSSGFWKHRKQPCATRLKQTLPLWLDSYQARHGSIEISIYQKILNYSPRTLDRITAPHRIAGSGRLGRKTGRASNRLKKFVPIRCGPQAFDEPGWFEADTVSHGTHFVWDFEMIVSVSYDSRSQARFSRRHHGP
jgi:hypothetical protein